MLFFLTTTLLVVVLQFSYNVDAQGFCLCTQDFVYDPTGECHKSAQYGLQNACFNCPVINATGTFNFCGSLYRLGFGACTQPGSMAAQIAACAGIGGDTTLTSFLCSTATGPNKSQVNCGASGAPTTATPLSNGLLPTATPTSGSARFAPHCALMLLISAIVVSVTSL